MTILSEAKNLTPPATVAKVAMRRVAKHPSVSDAVRVRRARESDLPALDRLYRELHLDEYDDLAPSSATMRAGFRKVARNRDHHLLVAEHRGEVVGSAHLLIFRHLGHGTRPAGIVENVIVRSDRRSRGIGARILEAAEEIARRERCYKMALTSNVARNEAHKFYEHLGWRRTHFGFSLELD
jgi:GNAT superfamily N-acetyltransferase